MRSALLPHRSCALVTALRTWRCIIGRCSRTGVRTQSLTRLPCARTVIADSTLERCWREECILAILHNFLAALLAKTAAEQSEAELTWAMAEQAMAITKETTPATDGAVMAQAKDLLRKQFAPREVGLVNRSRVLYATVSVLGYCSMVAFIIAFSLVPFHLFSLW